ncbi:hypothetical protein NLJ89_g3299 [Agrocybe chaxingu]|uniref:Endonuclease/exonuclease/phosphatase domain-containing protein n=1 Tax=Agrocybe chaxingu TaxID=84603 RepID=A0A9W8K4W7_9AGAR|nr:hypothetical protein NLJ89_g3299 [Agrocybe chaxingu]
MSIEHTPFKPFPIQVSDSRADSPPPNLESSLPFTGVELFVCGLRRDTTNSASEHLNQLLQNLRSKGTTVPPINVVSPPGPKPLDFVFISLAGDLCETPRPDILEDLRVKLDALDGIQARWKVSAGSTDKTRQVSFLADHFLNVSQLKSRLEAIFRSHSYEVQSSYNPNNSDRVVFNFTNRDHILRLLQNPPIIDNRTYIPTTPRYIQPLFGLEIAVNGVMDIAGAKSQIVRHLEARYGDASQEPVVRHSRLELNGSVYCCILRTPAITSHFLSDPWTLFNDETLGFTVPRPTYLYVLNSRGVPGVSPFGRPSAVASSSSDPGVQRQLDNLTAQSDTLKTTLEHLTRQQDGIISSFREAQDNMQQAFRDAENVFSLNNMLTITQSDINTLQSNRTTYRLLLATAQDPAARQEIEHEIIACDAQIQTASQKRQTLENSIQSRQLTRLPTLPPMVTPPAVGTQSTPSLLPPTQDANHVIESASGMHGTIPSSGVKRARTSEEDEDEEVACMAVDPQVRIATPSTSLILFKPSTPTFSELVSAHAFSDSDSKREKDGLPFSFFSLVLTSVLRFPDSWPTTASCRSCVPVIFSTPPRLCIIQFLFLLLFLSSVPMVMASVPLSSSSSPSVLGIRTVALNANGLGDPMKTASIENMVLRHKPHAVVIGETKNAREVNSRLFLPDYDFYETPGRPTGNRNKGKWGVILAIQHGLFNVQRLSIHDSLQGRVVALNLTIPTSSGHGFIHRLIGVYAPWNPGISQGDNDQNTFWPTLTELCLAAPYSWLLIGDLNVSMTADETTSVSFSSSPARLLYSDLLHAAGGIDIWHSQPNTTATQFHHTYKSYGQHIGTTGSPTTTYAIIDRAACSRNGVTSATISLLPDFIPVTDHRPISSHIILHAPPSLDSAAIPAELPPSAYSPRFKFPPKSEHYRFTAFAGHVDELLSCEPLLQDLHIDSDESFEVAYKLLSSAFAEAARTSFLTPLPIKRHRAKITNPTIQLIMRELRRINRLIAALRPFRFMGSESLQLPREPWVRTYLSSFPLFNLHSSVSIMNFRDHLVGLRRKFHKIRYAEERLERAKWQEIRSASQIRYVLHGGSSKYLYPCKFSSLPLAITPKPDTEPDLIVTGSEKVKDATVSYFQKLYHRTIRPPQDKPWMTTPSVRRVADDLTSSPFQWPQPMQLADLRRVLAKGNTRPTPGPDGWEKWMIKRLHDSTLLIILDLVNYIIRSSRFPDCVKPTNISTIHKRGPNTFLFNYRGIACSNLLLNLPFAWLNNVLSPYLAQHQVIPECQIATQPGVQGRDLISYLSQLQTWASREHIPLFILQRDQKKGFDMLEPQGFYDAIKAYNLPLSIIDLDCSSQSNVPYRVKTAYGFTEPFIVNGVTKQGGSLSPLKCTLTTSLCNRWIQDSAADDNGSLTVTTANSRKKIFHSPSDNIRVPVSMIEAMDDSLLSFTSFPLLQRSARLADRFQATYGWETEWRKSALYVYQWPTDLPRDTPLKIPSVDYSDPQSGVTVWNDVPVITDHTTFLRVPVNRPDLQFGRLQDIILNFSFPILNRNLPLTVLQRVVSQQVISKMRPHLALQPISPSDADKLDHMLAQKVHSQLGFPFRFKTDLLLSPISSRGFGFPSIAALNAALAVQGLQRDLNHHITPFHNMAQVTLADWSCSLNTCKNPLLSFPHSTPDFLRARNLPQAWTFAQCNLISFDLSFLPTDFSCIGSGNVSLRHLHNILKPFIPVHIHIPTRTLSNFERHNYSRLSDFGSFSFPSHSDVITPFFPALLLFPSSQYYLTRDWPLLKLWFAYLPPALHALTLQNPALLLPRHLRQLHTEQSILSLAHSHKPEHPTLPLQYFASDASSKTIHGRPSTTFAVAGANHAFPARISNYCQHTNILQGESYGLAAASILARHTMSSPTLPHSSQDVYLYTDHLNSISLLGSLPPDYQIKTNPARSFYRWILNIWSSFHPSFQSRHISFSPTSKTLTFPLSYPSSTTSQFHLAHSPAHTDSTTLPACLNRLVDHLASSSHSPLPPPSLPLPTFFMDDHMPFHSKNGFIESNLLPFISSLFSSIRSHSLDTFHAPIISSLYDATPPPPYPYTKATSSFSAVVQLYLRSGQLDTSFALARRHVTPDQQPWCSFGCPVFEDARHIFVNCPFFDDIRHSYQTQLTSSTSSLLQDVNIDEEAKSAIQNTANHLFHDSQAWPSHRTYYYLALLPPLPFLDANTDHSSSETTRLLRRISHDWHLTSIRLAARIWGMSANFILNSQYDVRRGQDSLSSRKRSDIMMLSRNPNDAHPFEYARILGIFHVDVVDHSPGSNEKPTSVEVLWVRRFCVDRSYEAGFRRKRLWRVQFLPSSDPDSFGFVHPDEVIRGCHLIPSFRYAGTDEYLQGESIARDPDELDDYKYYYVNIFVDRDMYMRYAGGGVGHYQVKPSSERAPPVQDVDEDVTMDTSRVYAGEEDVLDDNGSDFSGEGAEAENRSDDETEGAGDDEENPELDDDEGAERDAEDEEGYAVL